ncbi:cytochrome P450 [Actinoplanes sp. NPDC089786]|uniref:cytochrome P450 family protein n=1 Tax=Actinoplanes sp. NPDC089786 TaxID=3155185 RepID=UPI00342C70C0
MTQQDFADPLFAANPYPVYAEWQAEGPIRRVSMPRGFDAWLVTRYEDARKALTDPRLSKAPRGPQSHAVDTAISRHMLATDPPDHTRLRKLVAATFTTRRIEALRPRIEEITDALLDAMSSHDRVDLIDAFAFPLPIQVICELLGIPAEDQDKFRSWSNDIVSGSEVTGPERMQSSMGSLVGYIRGLIEYRRGNLGDDLLSGLIAVRDSDDRLTENELTSMVFLLLIAGHETTVNLIGNGTYLLLSDRDRWERLRADRGLLPGAIEEFLRYEGPVELSTGRVATEDFELAGQQIRAGDVVLVALAAANRDPARFDAPDELRFDRPSNAHIGFGHGLHYCLGAPLARLEAAIAFDKLLDRFPDLRLAVPPSELSWRPGLLLRGLHDLPVTL